MAHFISILSFPKKWHAFSFAKVSQPLKRISLFKPLITSVTMTVSHERNCGSINAINLHVSDKVDEIRIVWLAKRERERNASRAVWTNTTWECNERPRCIRVKLCQ